VLKARVEEALNKQIKAELTAQHTYLSMASYFYDQDMTGFARWLRHHADEEEFHAMKIYDFIHDRGGRAKLLGVDAAKTDWSSPLEVLQDALKHEQHVTDLINKLVELASAENDHATFSFLQWYVDEQVEEEAIVQAIIHDLERIGDFKPMLVTLDRELGRQVNEGAGEEEEVES
jgi:ferritin